MREAKNLTNIRLTESDTDGIFLHFKAEGERLEAGVALSTLLSHGFITDRTIEAWAREQLDKRETITIREFRNLVTNDSPDRKHVYGKFAMPMEAHKKQCENLKIGDKVFFFEMQPNLAHSELEVDIRIVQAEVVEG